MKNSITNRANMGLAIRLVFRAPIVAALAITSIPACQHSLGNANAERSMRAPSPMSVRVVHSATPAPSVVVTCPKPAWSAFLETRPEGGVGSVLVSSLGTPISATPGQPPHHKLSAGPALVIEGPRSASPDYYRVLGADGISGWAQVASPLVGASVAFESADVELADQIVEPMQQVPENLQTAAVGAKFAAVVGASDSARMEETWQLGAGTWLDTTTVPWLRVKSSSAAGWLPPSVTRVVWQVEEASQCNPFAGLAGLVRSAFLTRASQALRAWLPHTGATVRHVLEDLTVSWPAESNCEPGAALFPNTGKPPIMVMFDCDRGQTQVFSVSGSTSKSFYTMSDEKRAHLSRFELANLTGDAAPELILELGLRTSDDYESALLVLPVESAQPRELGVFSLGELSNDVDSNWLVTAKGREIGIARTSHTGLQVSRVTAVADGLREGPGYAALFASFSSPQAAQRDALSDPRRMAFPLNTKPPQRWATGSVFAAQSEACEALQQAGVSAAVRRLLANRPCLGKASTGK